MRKIYFRVQLPLKFLVYDFNPILTNIDLVINLSNVMSYIALIIKCQAATCQSHIISNVWIILSFP